MKMIKQVVQVSYHRNGVSGAPFHAVLFKAIGTGALMLGVVFEERKHVAVFDVAMLNSEPGVTFAENSWHGDHFETELWNAIDADRAAWLEANHISIISNCVHDQVENLVCIDCGRAFDTARDWRDAQAEARQP